MVVNDHGQQMLLRRERKKLRTRKQLCAVALDLFRRQGYEQTSVQQITEAADTAKATFFNYYPTKEHVLAEFHSEAVAGMLRDTGKRRTNSAVGGLLHLTRVAMRWAESEPELTAAIVRNLWGSAVLAEQDRIIGERFSAAIKDVLQQGVTSGEFEAALQAEVATALVISTLNGCVLEWVMSGAAFNLEPVATRRMKLLMRAFAQ